MLSLSLRAIAGAEPTQLHLFVDRTQGTETDAIVNAVPVIGELSGEPPEPLSVEVAAPGRVVLDLRRDVTWRLRVKAEGLWGPPVLLPGKGRLEEVEIRLVPTATLVARIEVPPGQDATPSRLAVRWRSPAKPPASPGVSDHTADCPVEENRWRCEVPFGVFDLRLRAKGYISHYFWERELPPGETVELGVLKLVPGASISGWLVTDDGSRLRESTRVVATPRSTQPGAPREQQRQSSLALATPVTERGFFHLQGLRPGAYELSAEQQGFVPLRSLPVTVVEASESELLDPLVLTRPAELRVGIEPPVDADGEPWKLTLQSPASNAHQDSGRASPEGLWTAAGLKPGQYYLIVADSKGSRLASEELAVEAPVTEHWVTLRFVEVEGRVVLGEDPLPARLAFGGSSGMTSVRMEADEEGRFAGLLPRRGVWSVDVRSSSPPVFRRLREVEVELAPGSSQAQLEIELPATRLEGEVVDNHGKGIVGATVLAVPVPEDADDPAELPSFTRTEEGGLFTFEGFEPATYRLQAVVAAASGQKRQSEPVETILENEDPFRIVRLVIGASTRFRGRVLVGNAGVPGVAVWARSTGGVSVPSARTGPDGRFELELPGNRAEVDLTVLAPGFVLFRELVSFAKGEEVPVFVEQAGGGTLVIRPLTPIDFAGSRALPWLIRADGVRFDLGTLSTWAALNEHPATGEQIEVPMMASGEYEVCWPPMASTADTLECRGGHLPAYGRLEILERNNKNQDDP